MIWFLGHSAGPWHPEALLPARAAFPRCVTKTASSLCMGNFHPGITIFWVLNLAPLMCCWGGPVCRRGKINVKPVSLLEEPPWKREHKSCFYAAITAQVHLTTLKEEHFSNKSKGKQGLEAAESAVWSTNTDCSLPLVNCSIGQERVSHTAALLAASVTGISLQILVAPERTAWGKHCVCRPALLTFVVSAAPRCTAVKQGAPCWWQKEHLVPGQ